MGRGDFPHLDIALFTIIRTDHNMLLLYHSHKHISYPIRTIARSAITLHPVIYFLQKRLCRKVKQEYQEHELKVA
ncbi:hypothetical protein [Wolbachia pipientis]|uniref:hypothetical protein n=1 Tax=Wolbachia pipientis TaxID=955 RepID=UPI001C7140CE|nr:hypothetical protein [Wolbachia pipientis]